jgi:nicotinate-nucleotide pyrophosphorylase (carboxylating)
VFEHNETLEQARARNIADALREDIGVADWTARLTPAGRRVRAQVRVREAAVCCGQPWFDGVFTALDATARLHWQVAEGARMEADRVILDIEADGRALLSAERSALNFLQLLSGVATLTRQHVDAIAGASPNPRGCAVLDTRKTLPGLRQAQKYAVRVGGGANQRMALWDGILIKENHIAAAGGVTAALRAAQALDAGSASRSRSRPWRSCRRRCRPVPAACCSTTSASPTCARRCGSTPAGPCSRPAAASAWKDCARSPPPASTASASAS